MDISLVAEYDNFIINLRCSQLYFLLVFNYFMAMFPCSLQPLGGTLKFDFEFAYFIAHQC